MPGLNNIMLLFYILWFNFKCVLLSREFIVVIIIDSNCYLCCIFTCPAYLLFLLNDSMLCVLADVLHY